MTKNSVRSLAAGLLIATTVLSYVYYQSEHATTHLDATAQENSTAEISEHDVKTFAEQHNLTLLTQKEYEELVDKANQQNSEQQEEKIIYQVLLDIPSGTSSQNVAKRLERANIIADEEALMNYLNDQNLEQDVKTGSYQLNSEMTIEEIASIITE